MLPPAIHLIPRASAGTAARASVFASTIRPCGSTSRIASGAASRSSEKRWPAMASSRAARSLSIRSARKRSALRTSVRSAEHREPSAQADDGARPDADGNADSILADSHRLNSVLGPACGTSAGVSCSSSAGRIGSGWPKTSCSVQPSMRSALWFHKMTRSSASTAMIARGEAVMIASSTDRFHFISSAKRSDLGFPFFCR